METCNPRKILLTIAYDGTDYCGFQMQPNGISVEGTVNEALTKIAGHSVKITGSSRTDAGVHAQGQRATFLLYGSIPTEKICLAANGLLPGDIVLLNAEEVSDDFHCRYSVAGKYYRYTVRISEFPSPFDRHFAYYYPFDIDIEAMKDAAACVTGTHDFRAFTASHSGRTDFVRQLDLVTVTQNGDYLLMDFYGKGFLYKMVRSIAGALLDVGRGYLELGTVKKALKTGDRSLLSLTAPSCGLTLKKIFYDDSYDRAVSHAMQGEKPENNADMSIIL